MESALAIASQGQREQVAAYLAEMLSTISSPVSRVVHSPPSRGLQSNAERIGAELSHDQNEVVPLKLEERHFEILDGETGYTYERIFCPHLNTAHHITVEDPYIRLPHQIDNFARFCALALRLGVVEKIDLITGLQPGEVTDDADSRLETLRRDLETRGVCFNWKRESALHDREIQLDNGWIIKIGRGLDFYHKPETWLSIEASDFSMRRCRQTKVDVFRALTHE